MENFTEELRIARKNAVLTQKATAELLGVPLRTYEAWETGKRCPTEFTQKSILEFLKKQIK